MRPAKSDRKIRAEAQQSRARRLTIGQRATAVLATGNVSADTCGNQRSEDAFENATAVGHWVNA